MRGWETANIETDKLWLTEIDKQTDRLAITTWQKVDKLTWQTDKLNLTEIDKQTDELTNKESLRQA